MTDVWWKNLGKRVTNSCFYVRFDLEKVYNTGINHTDSERVLYDPSILITHTHPYFTSEKRTLDGQFYGNLFFLLCLYLIMYRTCFVLLYLGVLLFGRNGEAK
jgi:hypothetical protein